MSVHFSNNGKINDLTVVGEILHRRATERSRDESSLWLFSINIPVYLHSLDGWCKQSKPQLKFLGGRKSSHLKWRLTQEKRLSSSLLELDIFLGAGLDKPKQFYRTDVLLHIASFMSNSPPQHNFKTKNSGWQHANILCVSYMCCRQILISCQ